MDSALAIINAIPFLITILMLIPAFRENVKAPLLTWLMAGTMGALFIWLLTFLQEVEQGPVTLVWEWVPDLGLNLSWYLDGLALMFALIVTGVGFCVYLYAGYYFDEHEERTRFYAYIGAFTGAMLGLVTAGNIITMFVMWELTSITSFLLIGFKGSKSEDARIGASRALVITGGGGLALLLGLFLLGTAAGSFEFADILRNTSIVNHDWYEVIVILVMLGAFTKSAQFPFHFWLPGAMSAPSPASAYLHSATMVKAGVYLLYRLYPTLGDTDLWQGGLMSVGITTMFIGALFAIRKRDLKALLAYTTISKLGTMVALIGLPGGAGLKAAAVGIIAHALYKGTFFLLAGTIEHATGTRNLDELGGLRKYMPGVTVIAVIVGLSMAGYPPLLGFVAKETLLDAMLIEGIGLIPIIVTFIASVLMVLSAGLIVWEGFFSRMDKEYHHFHAPSPGLNAGPAILAFLSLALALLLEPLLIPLLEVAVPKAFVLHLFPDHISPPVILSVVILIISPLFFLWRKHWLKMPWINMPNGADLYAGVIRAVEWSGDFLLRSQQGKLRYYLIAIMGVVSVLMLFGGYDNLGAFRFDFSNGSTDALKIMLLILTIGATLASIILRQHLLAALALGVSGYTIGGLFLLEPAPDVALVQFLVETLASVLIILMLARISLKQRGDMIDVLWKGQSESNAGIYRDLGISIIIGVSVGVFALAAVNDREERLQAVEPIAIWHLQNAYEETGVTDVVAAIVTDFRGTDTLIEITVFSMAALGILTLLTLPKGEELLSGRSVTGVMDELSEQRSGKLKNKDEISRETREITVNEFGTFGDSHEVPRLTTPLTRLIATVVFPFAFLISFEHVLYGGDGPGDGFTAGVVGGLAVALWFVVFGYFEARARLQWLRPGRLIGTGLTLAIFNALGGVFFSDGFFHIVEIGDGHGPAGIHLSSTLVFEIAIFLTVFGGVTMIMEAIAHPDDLGQE